MRGGGGGDGGEVQAGRAGVCGLRGQSEEQARRDRWGQEPARRPKVSSAGAEEDAVGEMGATDPGARTVAARVCALLVICGVQSFWEVVGGSWGWVTP